jgi:hypothetical protein
MRKHLVWFLAAILAISVAGYAWARADTSTSTATIKVTPSKLSKTKFKKATLAVETSTINKTNGGTPTNPATQPAIVKTVKLGFDDDLKFNPKGLAQCNPNDLGTSTTTAQAKQICGKAQVGSGSATACLAGGQGSPCSVLPVVVTAFNGTPKGGKPTIVLHSRVDSGAVHTTTVLVGTLGPGGHGDYDRVLTVPVPALPAIALTDFQTKVSKTFKVKGKKVNYIEARCHDQNKQLNMTYEFDYTNSSESKDTGSASSKCST